MKSLEENKLQYERLIEIFKAHDIGYFSTMGVAIPPIPA